MPAPHTSDAALWRATLSRVRLELANLQPAERAWLAGQITLIGQLQGSLDRVFQEVGGPVLCAGCRGGCCGGAKHHATLTNLLGYLLIGAEPPDPDFTRSCPFLGPQGCRLPVPHRPFNCVIFLCDELDARLTESQRRDCIATERALRAAYADIAARCPGASLHGLLLAAARGAGAPLLTTAA